MHNNIVELNLEQIINSCIFLDDNYNEISNYLEYIRKKTGIFATHYNDILEYDKIPTNIDLIFLDLYLESENTDNSLDSLLKIMESNSKPFIVIVLTKHTDKIQELKNKIAKEFQKCEENYILPMFVGNIKDKTIDKHMAVDDFLTEVTKLVTDIYENYSYYFKINKKVDDSLSCIYGKFIDIAKKSFLEKITLINDLQYKINQGEKVRSNGKKLKEIYSNCIYSTKIDDESSICKVLDEYVKSKNLNDTTEVKEEFNILNNIFEKDFVEIASKHIYSEVFYAVRHLDSKYLYKEGSGFGFLRMMSNTFYNAESDLAKPIKESNIEVDNIENIKNAITSAMNVEKFFGNKSVIPGVYISEKNFKNKMKINTGFDDVYSNLYDCSPESESEFYVLITPYCDIVPENNKNKNYLFVKVLILDSNVEKSNKKIKQLKKISLGDKSLFYNPKCYYTTKIVEIVDYLEEHYFCKELINSIQLEVAKDINRIGITFDN